jgi:hypothetical protein
MQPQRRFCRNIPKGNIMSTSASMVMASLGTMAYAILVAASEASPIFYVPLFIMGLLLMVLAVVEAVNE